jgi:putative endonuclease
MRNWYLYIVSNRARTLYTGVTDDLPRRVIQHKEKTRANAFTARYTFNRLVYYELVGNRREAALREKRVKNWPRAKRVALIESMNPHWRDLSLRWDLAELLR